jgi:hypothetical protein
LQAAAAKMKAQSTLGRASELGVTQSRDGLDPTERLLDPLAKTLACGIAGVTGRSFVDRRSAPVGILRHMRPHAAHRQN